MKEPNLTSIADIQQFLTKTLDLDIQIENWKQKYAFVEKTLVHFKYYNACKPEKGVIRKYLQVMTKYSRAQLNILIGRQQKTGRVKRIPSSRNIFTHKYSNQEIILLAKTDELHDFPNGCALKAMMTREATLYGHKEYANLCQISVTHIYNLRKDPIYIKLTKHYEVTKSKVNNIGERRKPRPNGKPGYIRADTVHQGDLDGEKGTYHINMIDEVLQFEFMAAVENISESYLIPILEKLLELFPCVIIEFHSDNGSEYINYQVVEILNRLLIKLSKSRSRKSTDNALVEGKNGAIIRKWMGYAFIPKGAAKQINDFYFGCFHEYVNYHRPCGFATVITDNKGKQKKIYKQEDYKTPFEKLKSLDNWEQYLKPEVTAKQLQTIAERHSDTEMAAIVQQERSKLFDLINLSL